MPYQRRGNYSTAISSQNAWWVLFPKSDEALAHAVQVQRSPDGTTMFGFKDQKQLDTEIAKAIADGDMASAEAIKKCVPGEYMYDCHMPPEVWNFIRKLLVDKEAAGELDFSLISVYDKLILANPFGGN